MNTIKNIQESKIPLWIYLANLPLTYRQQDIVNQLIKFGSILDVRMNMNYKKFIGSAYVNFQSMTRAEEAIQKLNGSICPVNGLKMMVKWMDTEENKYGISQSGDHRLFIGSLPRLIKRQDLYQLFSLVGKVETVILQDKQFWALIDYKNKQSAILAIRHFDGQVYFHGSHIPIDVRFKQKRYNSFMAKKHEKQELNPFHNLYRQILVEDKTSYYNCGSKKDSFQKPSPCSIVKKLDNQLEFVTNFTELSNFSKINDINNNGVILNKKYGPVGANLFLFHLPNSINQQELRKIFGKFGNILSVRIMNEKGGKPKGIGFVSYDNPASASEAIQQMNGYELKGKRLKVELNKKDGEARSSETLALNNLNYNFD